MKDAEKLNRGERVVLVPLRKDRSSVRQECVFARRRILVVLDDLVHQCAGVLDD